MKKIKKYVLLFAGLVIAFTGFTACASSDDDDQLDQNILGEAIKAQFTISIPMDSRSTTRQGSDVVQNGANIASFRGINDIKLYPSAVLPSAFDGTSSLIGSNISLTRLLIPDAVPVTNYMPGKTSDNNALLTKSNSVVYGDVALQTGTRTFLFYGKAIGVSAAEDPADDYTTTQFFKYGSLNAAGLVDNPGTVGGFAFTPTVIYSTLDETTTTAGTTASSGLATYLTSIANAPTAEGSTTPKWKSIDQATNKGLYELYQSFIGMKAGSSANLQAALQDLYFGLEANSHPVAVAIRNEIKNTTYVDIDDAAKTLTFKDAYKNYPACISMPDGAAVLEWTGSAFRYSTTSALNYTQPATTDPNMAVASIQSYVYPANLYYRGISNILTSEESRATGSSNVFVNDKDWKTEIATTTYFADGNAITSKTRSVVLVEPVQYAVGRLDISVTKGQTISSFTHNGTGKKKRDGSGNNYENVNPDDLRLTGVLIGGQKAVNWKFEPSTSGTEYTIYDNILESQKHLATTGETITEGEAPNQKTIFIGKALSSAITDYICQTLVLETYGPSGTTKDAVNVALEFENRGPEFVGSDGIVPTGTKFYLVGRLDVKDVTDNEAAKTGGKVFKQDFITRAQFTIADLKKAVNTIPDLRNPAVELGLSVDLSWQDGITFELSF